MPGHDVIVIGTSAGGVEALKAVVRGLPPALPATIFVVCHFPALSVSALPEILSRSGPLLAKHPGEGEPIYPGHIYVAPPNYHLLLEPNRVRLWHGPHENGHRPAIDPLFRSAARVYGPRVIGVVLTGALNDGVAGLLAIRANGGIAVVQDPLDAVLDSMPRTALEVAGADHVVLISEIPELLVTLVHQPVKTKGGVLMARNLPDPLERMPEIVNGDAEEQKSNRRKGQISFFTCPECGGALWQVDEDKLVRFRCHVGHAYYAEHLFSQQSDGLEAALWTAIRIFKERTVLARQLAQRSRESNDRTAAERFDTQAAVAEHNANLIQQLVVSGDLTQSQKEDEAEADRQ